MTKENSHHKTGRPVWLCRLGSAGSREAPISGIFPWLLLIFVVFLPVISATAEEKPLLFLGNKNLAPVIYLEDGKPSGLVVDLVRALEPTIGRPIEIVCMDWSTAQERVARGEADALMQINYTKERDKLFDFSSPLLQSRFSIFTRSSRGDITDATSLRGLRVGVEKGGLPQHVLQEDAAILLTIIPDFLDGFRRLATEELDAVVVDYRIGAYVLARNHISGVKVSGEPVAFSDSAIAVKEGNAELLAAINRGLDQIRRDGTYARIVSQWEPKEVVFLTKEQMATRTQAMVIGVLVFICFIAAVWMTTLYRELRRRRRAEEQWRVMFESSPVSLWVVDFSAVGEWFDELRERGVVDLDAYFEQHPEAVHRCTELARVVDTNEATLALLGAESKATLYAGLAGAFTTESLETFREQLLTLWSGKTRSVKDGIVNTLAGERRHVTVHMAVCLGHESALSRVLLALADITERAQGEEAMRRYKDELEETVHRRTAELRLARDAAEAANKAKSVFLANMSHELRTPLNAILGFSSLMRRDAELSEGQRENLEIINRSGEHLLALINDVLEIAKIEAGKLQLEAVPLDLGHLVRDVYDMMQLRARQKGLQLLLDMASDFPRFIRGDEARLRQILVNLVGNAVKFTEHGAVTLRLGTRENDHLHLVIEIEDTGPGIRPEDQRRLFKPFVQIEGGEQPGTGLGLAITRQFVELMGGSISVDSAEGQGALFRVELPVELAGAANVARQDKESAGEIVGLAPGQPCYRVLIVEDQRENRVLLNRLMTAVGMDVREAENGEECLRVFEEWRPDLIWMDRRMPVMDGEEAARHLRRLPGGDKVKIVAVTASAFKEEQQAMFDAGMDDFVRKPYRFGEIYDCMARQLGVRYRYGDHAQPVLQETQLAPTAFASVPDRLRTDLMNALESLDSRRIERSIEGVARYDPPLALILKGFAEGFDYPAILRALKDVGEHRAIEDVPDGAGGPKTGGGAGERAELGRPCPEDA